MGYVARYDAVVVAGVVAPLHRLYAHFEGGAGGAGGGVDVCSVLGRGVAVGEVQGFALGGGDEVVGVHYYAVFVGEEAHVFGFEGAGRRFGEGYLFEGLLEEGEWWGVGSGVQRWGDEASGHLLGASAGGDQAYPYLDEAHVRLARGHDPVGVEADFEPPAKRLAVRGRDDGFRGEAEGHEEVLESVDALADRLQVSILDGVRHLAEVRADGEVPTLVADDEPENVVALQRRQRPVAHLDYPGV